MVVTYQLAVYTGIPFTFLVNGWLLRHVSIKRLYSVGMLLSGVSMVVMMSLPELSLCGARRGRGADGHVVRPLLVQPRLPGPFQHQRLQPQLLLRPGELLRHEPEYRRAAGDRGLHRPLRRRRCGPGRAGLPDRHRHRFRAHVPGVGHRPPGPFPESARYPVPLLPLSLALESHAVAGRTQGDRPGLHCHGPGNARDDASWARRVRWARCFPPAACFRPSCSISSAARPPRAPHLSLRGGLVAVRPGGIGQRHAVR